MYDLFNKLSAHGKWKFPISPHLIVSTAKTSLPAFLYRLNVVEIAKIVG